MNVEVADKRVREARQLFWNSNFSQAVPAYEKLTRKFPRKASIWFEYGCAAGGARQFDLVERSWGVAVNLEPHNSELLLQMGHQYLSMRLPEKAKVSFERAVAVNPGGVNPRLALAKMLEQNHRFSEARELVASCLAINPRDDQARYFHALLDRHENKMQAAEHQLRELINSGPKHPYIQYASRFELAEVLNRTERFDEAMDTLAEAKRFVRALGNCETMLSQYDDRARKNWRITKALPPHILRRWSKEFPEKVREVIPMLAFLGGHPRSGTTLLEQILGAHPEVAALDESLAFFKEVKVMFNASFQLSPLRLNIIRRCYVEAVQQELAVNTHGKLILDKNPSPTVDLRLWLRVFPELRVIIALRDPRDVIISCYFQNFPMNQINANFLTLERLATHYSYLMNVWLAVRQWEGFAWLETKYEDIVADLPREGRRVTEFLGLTWHEAQARFYEKSSNKHLYSPTYHEASQPIYARSVSRWRNYQKYLEPILPVLAPYCHAFGYS